MDAGPNVVDSHDRFKRVHQGLDHFFIESGGVAGHAISIVEQRSIAVRIYDRDILWTQTVDGAGHQLWNRQLRLFRQAAAASLEDDCGFGFVLLLSEQRLLGHHQMNPHRFHFAQCSQGSLQFAFKGALVVHFFGEVRAGPVGCVKQFKSQTGAARKARRRSLETSRVLLFLGDLQGAIGGDLMRNIFASQAHGEGLCLFGPQPGIQGHVSRLSEKSNEDPYRPCDEHNPAGEQQTLVQAECLEELAQALENVFDRFGAVGGHVFSLWLGPKFISSRVLYT